MQLEKQEGEMSVNVILTFTSLFLVISSDAEYYDSLCQTGFVAS